jgi:hypothetical protein
MDSIADGSPRRLARLAGALYLINILGGALAITVVPAMLVVQGDLAATAQNIQAHELLYRSGLAAHLVVTTTNVPLAVIFYELFKGGEPTARPAGHLLHPGRDGHRGGRPPQPVHPPGPAGQRPLWERAVPGTAPGAGVPAGRTGIERLHHPHGVLRPRHPRVRLPSAQLQVPAPNHRRPAGDRRPGVSLLQLHRHPGPGRRRPAGSWIQLPALIGEGSLCPWLLVVGINLDRWNQQASRATQLQSTHLEALP